VDERANGLVSKRESQRAHATCSARSVLMRASDFAPPHFGNLVFRREFVDFSVPVLSAARPWLWLGSFVFLDRCVGAAALALTF